MGRVHIDVNVPALALRRAEAAAACSVSVETFDEHIRPNVPTCRLGGVTVYPVAGLQDFLTRNGGAVVTDLRRAA